ncbi:MAG: methylenetetrahydrofolate reductase [NAD(P)H] [Planctomycetota bacterium]|nr:methylenetetrahydrofolate reductase [NAD(P)H] [Planctomycetota bacterium]MDA1105879.1 methylenetetrahydrofolate reductase [NAD(P)H] [Planctomycetota bacterium]
MRIADLARNSGPTLSFEFFPPADESGSETLFESIAALDPLHPSFVSVTHGAGGSSRDRTRAVVQRIRTSTPLCVLPHLTCVGQSCAEIDRVVADYATQGVESILCLRGDRPANGTATEAEPKGEFRFAAELVARVRATHPSLEVGVAGYPEGHPETPNTLLQMEHLKAKVDAGADFVISQLFFDNRAFLDWRDRCRLAGVTQPLIAGIMPITSVAGLRRMAQLAAGTRFPAPLLRSVARAGVDPDAVRRVGIHWASEQCRDLLDHGVEGLHFYTLNRSDATRRVFESLGIASSASLRG